VTANLSHGVRPGVASLTTAAGGSRALRILAALTPLAAALLTWRLSLAAVDLHSLGEYGLLTELPPAWYAALAALLVGAALATSARSPNGWLIAGYVGAVAVVLYATVPLAAEAPTFSWTYKHIGVVRLIESQDGVDTAVDIYNRWPGFFALAAMFSRLAGLPNPVSYALWHEPLFALLDALLVGAIARAIVPDVRVAGAAALIFTTANWVGGQYFSPQAVAFALALLVILVVVRTLSSSDAGARWQLVIERLTRRKQPPSPLGEALRWTRRAGLAVVLVVDAVIVATHQLTPYVLVLQVGALVLLAAVRPRWVVLAMAALAVAYLLPNAQFVHDRYGLFTSLDPFSNAAFPTKVFDLHPVAGKRLNGQASQALTIALWAMAVLAAMWLSRRGHARKALPMLAAAFAPVGVLFVQSYGAEATLRVILFSTPWCAALIGWAISTIEGRRLRIMASLALPAALTALFVPAFLGATQLNVVSEGEVRASEYFYANAPPESVLVSAATGFPGNFGPRYPLMRRVELIAERRFRHRPLGEADVPAVIASMREQSSKGYVAFSTAQTRYVSTFQLTPPGALADLERAVAASPYFRRWYANADARLYKFVDGEADAGSTALASNDTAALP
jgi:hypothetical protein